MTSVVIDASAALAWLLKSQATPAAFAFLSESENREFQAPFIFDWEVRNTLLSLERGGRLDPPEYLAALDQLECLRIRLGEPIAAFAIQDLARIAGLSLFDAAYLSMALDRGAALASRDRLLLMTAQRHGVSVIDLGPESA